MTHKKSAKTYTNHPMLPENASKLPLITLEHPQLVLVLALFGVGFSTFWRVMYLVWV